MPSDVVFVVRQTVQNPKIFSFLQHKKDKSSKFTHLRSWNRQIFDISAWKMTWMINRLKFSVNRLIIAALHHWQVSIYLYLVFSFSWLRVKHRLVSAELQHETWVWVKQTGVDEKSPAVLFMPALIEHTHINLIIIIIFQWKSIHQHVTQVETEVSAVMWNNIFVIWGPLNSN